MENKIVEKNGSYKVKKFFVNYALYILIIALVVIYATTTQGKFVSATNLSLLITNASYLLVAAVGMTFVLFIAEIDLSIGSIGGLAAAIWIMAVSAWGFPLWLATLLGLATGAIIGCVNGFLIVTLKINSFLATLGMQIFLRGFIYITVDGNQVIMTDEIRAFINARLLGLSPILWIGIILAIIMMLVHRYTAFGRKVQAVGCNKKAADKVGISSRKITFAVFVLCGFFAGIAGILQACTVGMVNPATIGSNLEFLAITASVLGGTSLLGGVGSVIPGTLIGVIFLQSIENGLGLLGVNTYAFPIVRGIVIYLAMVTDSLKRLMGMR